MPTMPARGLDSPVVLIEPLPIGQFGVDSSHPHLKDSWLSQDSHGTFFRLAVDHDTRLVAGYALRREYVDGDVFLPGCFGGNDAGTEARLRAIRFLFSHLPDKVLGLVVQAKEDVRGLWVVCQVMKVPTGNEVMDLLKEGSITPPFEFDAGYELDTKDAVLRPSIGDRVIRKVNVYEVSLISYGHTTPIKDEAPSEDPTRWPWRA